MKKSKKKQDVKIDKKEHIKKLIKLIGNAVGIAMGAAVIVLSAFKKLDSTDAMIMIGIGLFCVSIPAIIKRD